jgi:hypothetical protein
MRELVAESERGISLMESVALSKVQFRTGDVRAATAYLRLHADYSAYHLLFALRRSAPEVYRDIPKGIRAGILCSALAHLKHLNDWGYLDPRESFDGEAACALLETGASALNCLEPLLDDHRSAPLFGTEEATMSSLYQYRRRDFAYRYVSLISGLRPSFDPKPEERDRKVEQLKAKSEVWSRGRSTRG